MRNWRTVTIEAKGTFEKSGPAQRHVYVVPTYESRYNNVQWLIKTAPYGFINSNEKRQHQGDKL